MTQDTAMSDENRGEIKLNGVAQHTTTWVRIKADGSLEIELYDFSDTADEFLGGDTALSMGVAACDVPKIAKQLDVESSSETALLSAIEGRFESYSSIQKWLKAKEIKFKKWHDPFA